MHPKLLVTLALLIGANALAPFQLSEPLGHNWNSGNHANFTSTWSKPFQITKSFLTGFSSGSMLSTNILRLSPENFDGFGLLSGLLKKNFTMFEDWNVDDLVVPDLRDKTVFSYAGSVDQYPRPHFDRFLRYYEEGGAQVTSQFIHDFAHVMPSNLPVNEEYHPEKSCYFDIMTLWEQFVPPTKSLFRNCGYNMAYYMLQALNPNETLKERELNHTLLGDFHAFNQTPFIEGNPQEAKMGEVGYIYIPHACKAGNYCQSVMFLHGCIQAATLWNDTEARRTGLLEYGATNNLIVIFPQNTDNVVMLNPDGSGNYIDFPFCWSSMETNDKYHAQITTLENMLHSLILGSEHTELMAMSSRDEITSVSLAEKAANVQTKEIDRLLEKSEQILQI